MKRAFKKIVLGYMLILLLSAPSYSNDLADDYMDIAKNYYNDGDKIKASEYIERVLEIDRQNLSALGLKAKINPPAFLKNIQTDEKPTIFDVPYVSMGNLESDTYYNQGISCYRAKDYVLAEESLKKAIKNNPENFRAYNTLGVVYWAQNKLEDAVSAFEKSNFLCKSFTVPLDNLAQIYKQQNDSLKTIDTLNKSISQNEDDYCAFFLLGNYYQDKDNIQLALEKYNDAINVNPSYFPPYFKISKIKEDNLDYSGSNSVLQKYLNQNPKNDFGYYLMAKNYLKMNDYNNAKISIYKAINLCNCKEYREVLGKIEYLNDEPEEALDSFISSISEETSSEIYNYIGMCYFNLHEMNKAITNISKAISMPNPRVLYYYNIARVYSTLKDDINYNRYMSFVKEFRPKSCQDYIDLSCIMLDCESKNSAISVINKGIEAFPKTKELYYEKIKIYDLTNDKDGIDQTKLEMERMFK